MLTTGPATVESRSSVGPLEFFTDLPSQRVELLAGVADVEPGDESGARRTAAVRAMMPMLTFPRTGVAIQAGAKIADMNTKAKYQTRNATVMGKEKPR